MRRLIINGDDFGLHESINEGIVAAYRSGCLTSASVMAGGAAFDDAARLAGVYPRLGIGVHLTLVASRPVSRDDVGTLLTQDGTFWADYGAFIGRYLRGKIDKKHIERELASQIQAVVDRKIAITHIDSHQHLHVLPGMAEVLARIAADFGIAKIRIPSEPITYWPAGMRKIGRFCAKTALTICADAARKRYAAQGIRSTDHFFGMMAGGSMDRETLLYILDNLPEGTSEIMMHPGANSRALSKVFSWKYHWQEEMETLLCDAVKKKIRAREIRLIDYGAL